MAIEIDTVALPAELADVTMYVVAGVTSVGVPVIIPLAAFKLKPAGNAGLIVNDVATPPLTVGLFSVIWTSLV
nr:hypothetical protein [Sapientia aquatica]